MLILHGIFGGSWIRVQPEPLNREKNRFGQGAFKGLKKFPFDFKSLTNETEKIHLK